MTLKQQIQQEILALVDSTIDKEIDISQGHLTVAEIAQEVLLTYAEV
jgi:hypothetical protein